MTTDNTSSSEKKWRKYAQLLVLVFLLRLSLRNGQQAATGSKQQFVANVAHTQDEVPHGQLHDEEPAEVPSSDANDVKATAASTEKPTEVEMATMEPKTDSLIEESTMHDDNAAESQGIFNKNVSNDNVLVEPKASEVTVQSQRDVAVEPKQPVLPKEPREYYEKLPPCEIKVANQRNA